MGDVDAEPPSGAPEPLGALIARIDRAVADLAEGADSREAMHALRSGLSDIYALTEQTPKIERAIDRVVKAGDRLAGGTRILGHPRGSTARRPCGCPPTRNFPSQGEPRDRASPLAPPSPNARTGSTMANPDTPIPGEPGPDLPTPGEQPPVEPTPGDPPAPQPSPDPIPGDPAGPDVVPGDPMGPGTIMSNSMM